MTCAVTNFVVLRAGDAKFPVVEVDRHALGQRHGRARRWPAGDCRGPCGSQKPASRSGPSGARQARGRQSIGGKAEVGRPHPIDHHAADDEKRDGDADLHQRRHAMHANRLASAAAGILLHRVNQVGTAEADGRQQTEQHADEQAQSGRDRDTGQRRDRSPGEPARPSTIRSMAGMPNSTNALIAPDTNASKTASKNRCRDETPPARAERRADRQLALAVGAAHQHHAGDVQAHDQQHRSREAKQDAVTRRDSGRPAAPIEVYGSTVADLNSLDARIALRQTGDRRRHQRVRLREVDARLEPAVDPHPVHSSCRREDSDSPSDAGAAPAERTARKPGA